LLGCEKKTSAAIRLRAPQPLGSDDAGDRSSEVNVEGFGAPGLSGTRQLHGEKRREGLVFGWMHEIFRFELNAAAVAALLLARPWK
jgi:hypothetical protein